MNEIRLLAKHGELLSNIAKIFDVTISQITQITHGYSRIMQTGPITHGGLSHNTSMPGESNPSAKLSKSEVLRIRSMYRNGGVTQEQLATQFGVTQALISKIIRKTIWREV